MSPKVLEEILIVTTEGNIDKVYFDQRNDYQVGHTIIGRLLNEAQVTHPYRIIEVLQKVRTRPARPYTAQLQGIYLP